MSKRFSLVFITLIALILGVVPLLTQGGLYFVGGDDMRLYYMFPKQYIQNLLLHTVTDNSIGGGNMGYNPATHPLPLVLLMLLVKTFIPANTQFVMYGLNWALAFIFFYKLIGLWLSNERQINFYIRVIASLFYIFSPFLHRTFYWHQMIVMFLLAAIPGTLYFFIHSVQTRNYLYVFTACLIFSVLSTNLSSLPWTIPVLITSVPLLIVEFVKAKKTFLLHSLLFVGSYAVLNISWLYHFIYLTLYNTGLTSTVGTYSTSDFIDANVAGVRGTSRLFSPLNGVVNRLVIRLDRNLTVITYVNLLFIAIITAAGSFLHREKKAVLVTGFVVALLGLLLSWLLMTPNFGDWGPELFVWLSLHVPFFTMFRNMFDKFAHPLAMYYALGLGLSLSILSNQFTNKRLHVLVGLILVVTILVNAFPLFQTRTEHVGVQAKMSDSFNDDLMALADYISKLKNPSRILWLPLNYPSFVNVEDKYNPGHYYSGPSPLRILSDRQDYAGQFSFITTTNIHIGESIPPMLRDKKYAEFGRMVQLLNARYVILDKQQLPESMTSYLYGGDSRILLEWQTEEFINGLLGEKLQNFGTRYTLYEINPDYNNDRIYLTDDYDSFPVDLPNVEYEKVSDAKYKVRLTNLSGVKKLVFLDTYYRDWTLYIDGPQPRAYRKGKNEPVLGFANGWEIDPDEIRRDFSNQYHTVNSDGSVNLEITLYFEPDRFNKPIRSIAVTGFVGLSLSQLALLRRKHENKD